MSFVGADISTTFMRWLIGPELTGGNCRLTTQLSFMPPLSPFLGLYPLVYIKEQGPLFYPSLEFLPFQHSTPVSSSFLVLQGSPFTLLPFILGLCSLPTLGNSGKVLPSSYCYPVVHYPLLRKVLWANPLL